MSKFIRIFLLTLLCVGNVVPIAAQDFPKQPVPPRIVNDFVGILSDAEQRTLERRLVAFNDSTSTQIAVVIVESLHGYEPNDYGTRLIDQWGIGQKGKDNGILILIKPKTPQERGQVYIVTGYGLEAVVPDATCVMITEYEMLPSFREGNYYEGINKAVNVLFKLTRSEYTADEYSRRRQGDGGSGGGGFVIIVIIIILIIAWLSRKKGHKRGIRSSSGFPWWMLGGGMGGFGSGRSSGGGFSGGGGFGGFGGGRSGGGGGGSSW